METKIIKSLDTSKYTHEDMKKGSVKSFISFQNCINSVLQNENSMKKPIGFEVNEHGIELIWEIYR